MPVLRGAVHRHLRLPNCATVPVSAVREYSPTGPPKASKVIGSPCIANAEASRWSLTSSWNAIAKRAVEESIAAEDPEAPATTTLRHKEAPRIAARDATPDLHRGPLG